MSETERLERLFLKLSGAHYRLRDPNKPHMVFLNRDIWYEVMRDIDINGLAAKYKAADSASTEHS